MKPEVFSSGFIDIMNNGQVSSSARLIKLYIGEPGKFNMPFSIYSGVSNNSFQGLYSSSAAPRNNDHLLNQYLNTLSGLINVSIDGKRNLSRTIHPSRIIYSYQLGERILTGFTTGPVSEIQTGRPFNFLNAFATLGLFYQTAAWEQNRPESPGTFSLGLRLHATYSNPQQLRIFLPGLESNGFYTGYSLGFAIEISNLVNIKTVYYRYLKCPEAGYVLPIYQFSFTYTLQKN